jgi:hypothetical protein
MTDETKHIQEGYEKKGGQNKKPSSPRPATQPSAQKPASKPSKK